MKKRKTPLSFHVIYWIMNIVSAFLWVLSHIFIHGLKLREEQELTI